jgi:inosose dehydratase
MPDWRLGYHANCWGPLGGDAVGVTSITNLTYRTFGDMKRAIAEIGSLGYEGVELFDGNLLDFKAAELRSVLDGSGVSRKFWARSWRASSGSPMRPPR